VEWTLDRPDDPTVRAHYGHDPERGGPWCELEHCGVVVNFDSGEVDYDVERPLLGVLRFLAEFGFRSGGDVADALAWLSEMSAGQTISPLPQGPRRAPRRGVRRVLRVIEHLRAAVG
jgi:hypothetical protein